jgi:periplasmic protein TonB
MTAEKILQSDVLDILFEGRNKMYGAYELRRTYNRRIKQSLGVMVLTIGLLTGGYLFSAGKENSTIVINPVEDSITLKLVDDKTKPEVEPPAAKPKPPQQLATVQETTPLIQPDELVPVTEVHKQETIDTSVISTIYNIGLGSDPGDVVPDGPPGDGTASNGPGNTQTVTEPAIPAGPIDMSMADEMPQYPGGTGALVRYMVNNLTSELEPGMKYVLKTQFVIDEEGKVSEAVILSSDEPSLNPQVIKALRKMKQWKPGRLHGKNVAVRFVMPVTFMGGDE